MEPKYKKTFIILGIDLTMNNGHWVITMGNCVVFKFGLDPKTTNSTIGRDWNPCT